MTVDACCHTFTGMSGVVCDQPDGHAGRHRAVIRRGKEDHAIEWWSAGPPVVWYHGTSQEAWAQIQQEGVLWGRRNAPSRCTYLCDTPEEAAEHGGVVLEVEWFPSAAGLHNYAPGCWQVRTYDPIPLRCVRVLLSDEEVRADLEDMGFDSRRITSEGAARIARLLEGQRLMPDSFDYLFDEIMEWKRATFPAETQASALAHFMAEASELEACPSDGEEIADCVMLLLSLAAHAGVSLKDEMRAKLEKNRRRKWGEPNADGFQEHVRTLGDE